MAISSLRDLDRTLSVEGTCAAVQSKHEHYPHGWTGTWREGIKCALCGLEARNAEELRYMNREHSCIPQGAAAHAWRQSPEGKAFEKRRRFFDGNTFVGEQDYESDEPFYREGKKVPHKTKHRK